MATEMATETAKTMPYDFKGKRFLITGAGSGIGRATAIRISELGGLVIATDIDRPSLRETTAQLKSAFLMMVCDVSSFEQCQETVTFCFEAMGGTPHFHHVFNCAGVNPTEQALVDTTEEYWDTLVNTNLKGIYNMTKAAIPHMSPRGSSFVNVSSILGLHPSAGNAIYCATKYAVIGFSKSMALELASKNIRTNVVAPGYINTPTNSGVVAGPASIAEMEGKVASGRLGTPEEVADVVAFLFSDEARYMNGSVVEINGGTG